MVDLTQIKLYKQRTLGHNYVKKTWIQAAEQAWNTCARRTCLIRLDKRTINNFTMIAKILARSLANFIVNKWTDTYIYNLCDNDAMFLAFLSRFLLVF